MGNSATYVKYTPPAGAIGGPISCEKDSTCWTAAGATTAAAKEKVCCWRFGVIKDPTGTKEEIDAGNAALAELKIVGLPTSTKEYTKYCEPDYAEIILDA